MVIPTLVIAHCNNYVRISIAFRPDFPQWSFQTRNGNCNIEIIVENCLHYDNDFTPLLFKSLLLFVTVVVVLASLEQFKPGKPIKDNQ